MHRCITIFPATIQDRDTMPGYRYMTILKHTFLSIVVILFTYKFGNVFSPACVFLRFHALSARMARSGAQPAPHRVRPTKLGRYEEIKCQNKPPTTATTDARQHKLYAIYIVQQSLYPFNTVLIYTACFVLEFPSDQL